MTTLDATPATEALRVPGASGDLATLVHQAGGRRRRGRRPGHRGDVHASRLRRWRRTPATCSSCCRCAAAWTACRPSCPRGDPDYETLASRTSRSPRDSCCPWAASSGCTRRWGHSSPSTTPATSASCTRSAWPSRTVRTSRRWRRWSARRPAPRCGPAGSTASSGLRPDGRTIPGHPAGVEHGRERVPGTGPGARDVVDRLVRPGRRVERRRRAGALGHGAAARARGGARR